MNLIFWTHLSCCFWRSFPLRFLNLDIPFNKLFTLRLHIFLSGSNFVMWTLFLDSHTEYCSLFSHSQTLYNNFRSVPRSMRDKFHFYSVTLSAAFSYISPCQSSPPHLSPICNGTDCVFGSPCLSLLTCWQFQSELVSSNFPLWMRLLNLSQHFHPINSI